MFKSLTAFIAIFAPSMAFAHSGHGQIESSSIWHWLLEVDHIGWSVPAVVVLFVLMRSVLLKSKK